MSSFLSDLGRANPVGQIQSFQMNQKQMAVQDLNLKKMTQDIEITQRKEQAEIDQIKKQTELDNSPMHVFSHQMFINAPQGVKDIWSKHLVESGVVDQNGVGKRGAVMQFIKDAETTTKGLETFVKPMVEYHKAELDNVMLAIQEERAKDAPNEKKIESLNKKAQTLSQQWGQSSTILSEAYKAASAREKEKDKQAHDIELEKLKQENEPENASDKYKVVGGRLVDISGETPKVVIDKVKDETSETLLSKGLVKVGDSLIDVSDPKNPKPVFTKNEPENASDYRQWYFKATQEAMGRIFANKPEKQSEINIFLEALEKGDSDTAAEQESSLTQQMTQEQYEAYKSAIEEFMNRKGVPQNVKDKFNNSLGDELPDPVVNKDKIVIDTVTGEKYKSDGKKWNKI